MRSERINYYWGVKEKLLEETNFILPKKGRKIYFLLGMTIGFILGITVTLLIVWLAVLI